MRLHAVVLGAVVFSAALIHATPADAVPVILRFEGTVTSSTTGSDSPSPFFPIGSSATWELTYESETPPDPFFSNLFDATYGLQFSIAGYQLCCALHATIVRSSTATGLSFDNSIYSGGDALIAPVGTPPRYGFFAFDFGVQWPTAGPPSTTMLPTEFPTSPAVGGFTLTLCTVQPNGRCFQNAEAFVFGTMTSVRAVPEPSTLLMAAVGAVVAGARYYRRRRP